MQGGKKNKLFWRVLEQELSFAGRTDTRAKNQTSPCTHACLQRLRGFGQDKPCSPSCEQGTLAPWCCWGWQEGGWLGGWGLCLQHLSSIRG